MPLSATEKSALAATAQTILDEVNALTIDPAVNPLQAPLDAANASLATANASLVTANANIVTLQNASGAYASTIAGMQAKIDSAKAALQAAKAADVIEDARHADALTALG